MISDVQAWVTTPSTNLGWFIIGDETATSAKRFDSGGVNIPVLEVTYTTPLSDEEFSLKNEFSISPNPSKSDTQLVLPSTIENVKLEVYDVLGKKIYSSNYQANSRINVSNWHTGVYLFKVTFENSVVTKRFIKN